mmetsp:Transcript_30146/g.72368  ORF Transcript_30146/g.72368 Transcript_30146/m.72368 type:complete len:81 (-) Transcript_30146:715-957(-)
MSGSDDVPAGNIALVAICPQETKVAATDIDVSSDGNEMDDLLVSSIATSDISVVSGSTSSSLSLDSPSIPAFDIVNRNAK